MSYHHHIAKLAFMNAEDGTRLFYLGGPLSRPCVVPDAETEAALLKARTQVELASLVWFIGGQSIILVFWPQVISDPSLTISYLVALMACLGFVVRLACRRYTSGLRRLENRLPLRQYYQNIADRQLASGLWLGLFGSIGLVLSFLYFMSQPSSYRLGNPSIVELVCFGFVSLLCFHYGYALLLKLRLRRDSAQTT
jgi:hypothetical protein